MKGTIGPYRIIERLGTGGMGEVFKAFDDRLQRWVAIKRIRPGREDTEENRERFVREARATAQLNHSSIVHVYDIFRDDDSDCIVMEYIEGRTLQSITNEAPLPPLQAAELGKEIAEGLAVAHTNDILHRDLKTENIIVTPDGHAKILDFGLAKRPQVSEDLDGPLTGKGQLVGTSRTMSPEYVGGDKVDHRSDLFSLGVLLYETVTGQSPFKAQNTLATLKQLIVFQQPPTREVNPEVPEELSDLIDRLLEKSPDDRPQSAREVAAELGRISGQLSSDAIKTPEGSAEYSWGASGWDRSLSSTVVDPRLRRYWIGLAVLVVAALTGAYFLGFRTATPTPPGEVIQVVLGDFQNLTEDPLLDESLDIAFRVGLEQSRRISIMPEGQVEEALARMQRALTTSVDRALGIEICQREGAQALVIGSIVKVGTSYSLSAEIIDPQTERRLHTTQEKAASQGDILGALERVVQDIRTDLGESLAAIEESTQPLEKVTTPDLEALKLYSLGLKAGNTDDAIQLHKKALELDPEFAMAHFKLAIGYQALGQSERVAHHFGEALKYSERLTPFEELYVDGWTANLHRTPEEMIRAWSLMATVYPENQVGHNNLGMVHWLFKNQFAEAAEAFRGPVRHGARTLLKESEYPLGYCELALENYSEALALFKKHQLIEAMADVYIAGKRYPEALAEIDKLSASSAASDHISSFIQKTMLFADQGRFQRAIPLANEAADLAQQRDDRIALLDAQMARISFLAYSVDDTEFQNALTQGIERATKLLRDKSAGRLLTPVPHLAILGKVSARSSALDQAEAVRELIRDEAEASGIPLWSSYAKALEGEIRAAQGRQPEAIALFEEALGAVEFFQGRESLARAHAVHGDTEKAIAEYSWLAGHRGRAFAECLIMCSIRARNILDWSLAHAHLGRLYEQSGRLEEAASSYRIFVDQWSGGDQPLIWKKARESLEAIDRKQAL